MKLTQLVYISQRTEGFSDEELENVIAASAQRNLERGITGVLLVSGQHVMQLIEGDGDVIDALFERIWLDERHHDVRRLLRKPVSRRMFPEWGMRIVKPREDASLDHGRLSRMIGDIQAHTNTRDLSVEARVLLNDFKLQLN